MPAIKELHVAVAVVAVAVVLLHYVAGAGGARSNELRGSAGATTESARVADLAWIEGQKERAARSWQEKLRERQGVVVAPQRKVEATKAACWVNGSKFTAQQKRQGAEVEAAQSFPSGGGGSGKGGGKGAECQATRLRSGKPL